MKKILITVNVILAIVLSGFVGYIIILLTGDSVINQKDLLMASTTKIVDESGHDITNLYIENRQVVPITEVPKDVQHAFIATEDARFYQHGAIDFRGTLRAIVTDVLARSKVEGGSTITQQLAKNLFLTDQKTIFRKVKEAAIAVTLERNYSKQEILGMYLNDVYFGHGAYGLSSAAKFYFNKKVQDLTAEEGALLAAQVKGPTDYSPINHPKAARNRRDLVLSLMEKHGYLSKAQLQQDKSKPIALDIPKEKNHPEYFTYIDMVIQEAKTRYHISADQLLRGGYKIVVPMSRQAESASYKAFKMDQFFKGSNPNVTPNGAFVLMDSRTGGVIAVQGGRKYVREGLNHTTVDRQPGSTFKPLAVYGPALNKGEYTPYSLLTDKPLVYSKYNNYAPKNYDNKYSGETTMYDALTYSTNASAVWLLNQIGIGESKKYLKKMGFKLPDKGLAIALGGLQKGVTPLHMASAYTAFSNNGKMVKPYFIQAIYNQSGHLIGKAVTKPTKIFSAQTSWYMTKMLQSVVQKGTASAGYVDTALAGKTGSTGITGQKNGLRDAWFTGYTPKVTGAVWIGYDQTTSDQYLTGSSEDAAQMFKTIINQMPDQSGLKFKKPAGVKDLPPPIHLGPITQLKAVGTLGRYGLPAIKLTWKSTSDAQAMYHIYEVDGKSRHQIAEVKRSHSFVIDFANPFSAPTYQVVPYNPQTRKEGQKSTVIKVDWFGALIGN